MVAPLLPLSRPVKRRSDEAALEIVGQVNRRRVRGLEMLLARALERGSAAEARRTELQQLARFLEELHGTKNASLR